MSTKFEDRLLTELRAEVERLEHDAPAPVRTRVFTARRAGLGLAVACAATAATVVALPGSGASSAYAVDQNPDGTVTVSLFELSLDQDEQESLAEELREAGITVATEEIPEGYQCELSGDVQSSVAIEDLSAISKDELSEPGEDGGDPAETVPLPEGEVPEADHEITMRQGDTLVIANAESPSEKYADFLFVEGAAGPCEMVPVPEFPGEQ